MNNSKITSEEYDLLIEKSSEYRNLKLREGQSLMNALFHVNRSIHSEILATEYDCFYDNKKIDAFWQRIL